MGAHNNSWQSIPATLPTRPLVALALVLTCRLVLPLRPQALCTEASLQALRRHYPQIYSSDDRLLLDPAAVAVQVPLGSLLPHPGFSLFPLLTAHGSACP